MQAIEDQISSFGQTPSQLFRKRHGKRGPPPAPTYHPLLNGPDTMKLAVVGRPPTRRYPNHLSHTRSYSNTGKLLATHPSKTPQMNFHIPLTDLHAFFALL